MKNLVLLYVALFTLNSFSFPGKAQNKKPNIPINGKIHIGKVIEVIQTKTYTYLKVQGEINSFWAAVSHQKIEKGKEVSFSLANPFKNFKSKALNRTFDTIYLVNNLAGGVPKKAHGRHIHQDKGHTKIQIGKINKAQYTVAEIFSQKEQLANTEISVRGVVVKFTPEVMGQNWIHIQDGSGKEGSNDLTITTSASFKAGDTVLVKGKLILNKDYGYGYLYGLIIEKGSVTVSQ